MKEIKLKPGLPTISNGPSNFPPKNIQATEEQIRYAKLSQQMNSTEESKIQEKMKEVSEITRKPPDIVSIALHDCCYDTNLAIQNILEGDYDEYVECEWQTKSTKSRKKPPPSVETSPNHNDATETNIDKLCDDFGTPEPDDQKINNNNNKSRGGGGRGRGRSNNDNFRRDKSPSDDKCCDHQPERTYNNQRGRSSDRSRGRGRGRGMRGGLNRGGRGGRGGFGRGGNFRGSGRQGRGFNRGNYNRDNNRNRRQDNDIIHTQTEDDWDSEPPAKTTEKVADWDDEIVSENLETDWARDDAEWTKQNTNSDWSKDNWGDQPDPGKTIFSHDLNWSQLNGQDADNWNQSNSPSPTPKENRLQYLPENIDAAVIRSIPNSSTTGEVTSYQPTDDISRYISSPSNQFPSSHQEGGLTNSLNDRVFSSPASVGVSDAIHRTIASMPIVSGVTESHKLEQEQLRTSKIQQSNKPRRTHNKYVLPSQPVVMPRSAQMVNDVEEQFRGLEFGSGPLSPRVSISSSEKQLPMVDLSSSKNHHANESTIAENVSRQPIAAGLTDEVIISHSQKVLPSSTIITVTSSSKIETSIPPGQIISKVDVLKTPPGFKPLDQNTSHFLTSAVRSHNHLAPEPIPFPSSTNRSSPTPAINVYSRNGGLGTSVVISDQPPTISNYADQKVYDQHEKNINAEKIIAEQTALAEKQFLAEQQLVLAEKNERTRPVVDQSKPQSKLINNQLQSNEKQKAQEELSRAEHRLSGELPDQRKSLSDPRLALNEHHRQSSKDGIKLGKGEVDNISSKLHNQSTNQHTSGMTKSTYTGGSISKDIMNLTATSSSHTTNKTQGTTNKTTSAPPGVLTPMNLYAGVQPGMIQAYQQQALHGYSYDELLQMQRVPMGPPYTYDVSMYPAGASSAREGIQTYQGNDTKFSRGADESSPVNIQGSAHVAAGSIPTQQQAAYLNATGQLPYGYTYAYQPNVLPQGGVFPAFTTPSVYQMPQGKGTQFPNQYQATAQQQQGAYNSSKYSGTSAHEYSKGNYSGSSQAALSAHPKGTQQSTSTTSTASTQSGPRSGYKSPYNQDGKGYLAANSPTSMTTQHGLHMHNQAAAAAAHIGNVNHYLVQPHTNMMTHSGQISASHISQQQIDASSHRSQVHQIPFSGNQQKRDTKGGSYGSYWLGNR